ncbi:MAG: site-2 protease family protein [Chloroflexi bacterium]|nr:site-2 protease family protein [Chloroflexota bacterium]
MDGSFTIGRLYGIDIRLHYSWFIAFFLIVSSLATGYFPERYPEWTRQQSWLLGAITTLLFFASVLAHELAHSLAAIAHRIPVKQITLFIFGGVSNIEQDPHRPGVEFQIAVVGPLSSLLLAGLFWLAGSLVGARFEGVTAIAGYLTYINVALALFNLVPGFPLDGGRILRSIVWAINHNFLQATRIASLVGQGVAHLFIFGGLWIALGTGNWLSGFWLMFIGWFLSSAAQSTYQHVVLEALTEGLPVTRILQRDVTVIPGSLTVGELVRDHMLRRFQRAFLVSDRSGLRGLVTLNDVQKVPQEAWDRTPLQAIMTPREDLVTISPEADVLTALRLMVERDINQLPVLADGRLVGLVDRSGVLQAIELRQALPRASSDQAERARAA